MLFFPYFSSFYIIIFFIFFSLLSQYIPCIPMIGYIVGKPQGIAYVDSSISRDIRNIYAAQHIASVSWVGYVVCKPQGIAYVPPAVACCIAVHPHPESDPDAGI